MIGIPGQSLEDLDLIGIDPYVPHRQTSLYDVAWSVHDFADDLSGLDLVIHCGSCIQNRGEILSRISRCRQAGVPITNCGVTIAYKLGIFRRALSPFPAALAVYEEHARQPS